MWFFSCFRSEVLKIIFSVRYYISDVPSSICIACHHLCHRNPPKAFFVFSVLCHCLATEPGVLLVRFVLAASVNHSMPLYQHQCDACHCCLHRRLCYTANLFSSTFLAHLADFVARWPGTEVFSVACLEWAIGLNNLSNSKCISGLFVAQGPSCYSQMEK